MSHRVLKCIMSVYMLGADCSNSEDSMLERERETC